MRASIARPFPASTWFIFVSAPSSLSVQPYIYHWEILQLQRCVLSTTILVSHCREVCYYCAVGEQEARCHPCDPRPAFKTQASFARVTRPSTLSSRAPRQKVFALLQGRVHTCSLQSRVLVALVHTVRSQRTCSLIVADLPAGLPIEREARVLC